jgi:hypothetical protein
MEVIEADLLPVRAAREIDQANIGAALVEECLECRQRLMHRRLDHHVGIEHDVDAAAGKGDLIPIWQWPLRRVLLLRQPEPPHADQSDAAQPRTDCGI